MLFLKHNLLVYLSHGTEIARYLRHVAVSTTNDRFR